MSARLVALLEFTRLGVAVKPGDVLDIADTAEAASMLRLGFARPPGEVEHSNIRGYFAPLRRRSEAK